MQGYLTSKSIFPLLQRPLLARTLANKSHPHSQCYCSSYSRPIDPSQDFIKYSDSACSITCPGDITQKCGGKVSMASRLAKRQIVGSGGDMILLTLYNNTAGDVIMSSSMTSTITTASAVTDGPGGASMSMSNVFSTPAPPLVTTPSASSSDAGSQTDNPILNSASTPSPPVDTDSAVLHSLVSSQLSQSQTLSPILISTTYTMICPYHPAVCPIRTETCFTTTVTALHCGCTETPLPEVPMTTTVVEGCATTSPSNENDDAQSGGNEATGEQEDDSFPMTTLTVPCTESISSLEASVTAWSAASAKAQAQASYAAALATATTTANTAVIPTNQAQAQAAAGNIHSPSPTLSPSPSR